MAVEEDAIGGLAVSSSSTALLIHCSMGCFRRTAAEGELNARPSSDLETVWCTT